MDKGKIAEILVEIGTLLELKGENPFKTRAYTNAARALESLTEPLDKLIAEKRLGDIPGIGEAIEKKVTELFTSGRLPYYEELKASVAPGLVEMLGIPGMGPKKVKALHDKLGVQSIAELETACKDGKVAVLDGFGEKTQAKILDGILFKRTYAERHHLDKALAVAEPILEILRNHADVIRCSTGGSLRRWRETIGDIDFLASSKHPERVIEFFATQPGVLSVSARGDTKTSVILEGGIQADLRVVSDVEYPFALAYFTGSKEHNIVMRQRAIARGLRLNEYGLFKSHEETRDPKLRLPSQTEEDIFVELGLAYIPPELRENLGEFAAAEQGKLPKLVEWTDLRGALHNHSTWSDGHQTLDEIAAYAQELGLEYWAVTDHSKSSFQAHGLDPARLLEQLRAVAGINRQLADSGTEFRLLSGSEVDILGDGRLDYNDELLSQLDVVVASVHAGFSKDEAEMTKRIIKAVENPHVQILGHLSGRLLLEREPYAVNTQAVIDACAATGTWIELNCNPWRFDMDWRHWQYARGKGVQCVINPDAHRAEHFSYLRLGAGVARKGWLEKADVMNTRSLQQLMKALGAKRARA